jgi:hypothetical protein
MNYLYTAEIVTMMVLWVLIIVKTIHFLKTTHRRKILNWFYFNKYSIYDSHNSKSAKAKKTQNILTVILAFLLVIAILMELLTG